MRTTVSLACLFFLGSPALGQQERQTVIVGPWTIATTYKGDKFDSCTMTRSASGLGIAFVRNQDGLLLTLDSTNGSWNVEQLTRSVLPLALAPSMPKRWPKRKV
jgi:hypothetical protein